MNSINTQLDLMIELLTKKVRYLQNILKYTNEQLGVIQNNPIDYDTLNVHSNKKETDITEVSLLDNVFNGIYKNIHGHIINQPQIYKEKINALKQLVTEVGELDVAIKVQEERNRTLLLSTTNIEKNRESSLKKSNQYVSNYYSKSNNKKPSDNSPTIDFLK